MSLSIPSSKVQIRCKGLLFDMDGILIASLESVERAWRKWAVIRGVDPGLACKTAHGCRAVDTFAKLRHDLDVTEEIEILENFEMTDFDDVGRFPGAKKSLPRSP